MYSTRNLIVNGGFSRMLPTPLYGWDSAQDTQSGPWWHRIAVPTIDRNGIPHSSYAVVLNKTNDATGVHISQNVPVSDVPTQRFVFRVTAQGMGEKSNLTLVVAIRDANTPGSLRVVSRRTFELSSHWERYRLEFELPKTFSRPVIEVELHGPNRSKCSAMITDVRLVGLLQVLEDITIRFDTRGGMMLASSRLRAFLLEDYLNLLGCRTCLNGGRSFDLYICQKIQPWLRLAMAKMARKPIVFDLDDNDLLISPGRAANIHGFARATDGVSVGSEFLRELASHWNPRPFLLENPVDVLDQDMMRSDSPWNNRLVWFGMPENRWMLDRLGLDRRVTTITRGGDIEYQLKAIDEHLVASDLALLPVFLNEETRAKNANRMVKCVGLGLPFLASDTAEHRRALERLQMPDEFLVRSEYDWGAKIEDVSRRYSYFKDILREARPQAFKVYGVESLAADWIRFCTDLIRGAGAVHRGN